MEALILWFQPLLWIIGTITALGCFVRFCSPVWKFLQAPKEMKESIEDLNKKMSKHFAEIDEKLAKYDAEIVNLKEFSETSNIVHQSLLRDRLLQGYHHYKEKNYIPHGAYQALCEIYEIYRRCKGNSYVDAVMENLHQLYREQGRDKP